MRVCWTEWGPGEAQPFGSIRNRKAKGQQENGETRGNSAHCGVPGTIEESGSRRKFVSPLLVKHSERWRRNSVNCIWQHEVVNFDNGCFWWVIVAEVRQHWLKSKLEMWKVETVWVEKPLRKFDCEEEQTNCCNNWRSIWGQRRTYRIFFSDGIL